MAGLCCQGFGLGLRPHPVTMKRLICGLVAFISPGSFVRPLAPRGADVCRAELLDASGNRVAQHKSWTRRVFCGLRNGILQYVPPVRDASRRTPHRDKVDANGRPIDKLSKHTQKRQTCRDLQHVYLNAHGNPLPYDLRFSSAVEPISWLLLYQTQLSRGSVRPLDAPSARAIYNAHDIGRHMRERGPSCEETVWYCGRIVAIMHRVGRRCQQFRSSRGSAYPLGGGTKRTHG